MKRPLAKILFGLAAASYWEEIVRPALVAGDVTRERRRAGDPRPVVVLRQARAPLPFADGELGAVVLVDSVERLADPRPLLAEARRVADDVHVVMSRMWTPLSWLDPRNRWVLLGNTLYPAPGRSAKPVPLGDASVSWWHGSIVSTAKKAVEDGVASWLSKGGVR